MKIPIKKMVTLATITCICLIFVLDLTMGIQQYIPQSISKALVCCLVLIGYVYLSFYSPILRRRDILNGIVGVYIVFLLFRLVNDFVLHDTYFFMYKSPITLFFFVFNLIVIPYLFYQRYKLDVDVGLLNKILLVLLGGFLLLSIRGNVTGAIEVSTSDRYTGYGGIDIIYYGHLGVSMIIIGISILMNSGDRIFKSFSFLACCLIGFLAIVFSGSRGPFVALCAVLLYKYFSSIKSLKAVCGLVLLGSIICLFYIDIIIWLNDVLLQFDITSFSRIAASVVDDMSTSGRDMLFVNAFNDFLDNPIFGKSYLLEDGSYVHNIILEQFRALGIIGGILFLLMNVVTLKRGFWLLRTRPQYSLIPMLFLQYFVFGMFSRTITAIPQYWLCFFVLNNLYNGCIQDIRNYSYLQK